eukprot:maker-scaffold370_size193435-snap-gene-0.32 protein:Tk07791 transcript:maker-scaffold370_size193435-snap-gene-0.32-mRNA-1 annotation:"cytoplasmic trna 2-thiolation protein 2 a"
MCSREEESVDGALSLVKAKDISLESTCKKCRESRSVLNLRARDTYCKACFLTTCNHRFRSTLGKHKIMRRGDRVLVAFSGNQGSMYLLQCLKQGYGEDTQKKLLFTSSVIVIDELGPFEEDPAKRMGLVEDLVRVVAHFELPCYVVPLECALRDEFSVENIQEMEGSESSYRLPSTQSTQELREVFEAIKEISAKEDLLKNMKHNLLHACAKTLEMPKIFLAESQTSVAVNLLSGISLGRGMHLPNDVGFLDSRFKHVQIIRPLRELTRKEIALANFHQRSPDPVIMPCFTALKDPSCSIEKVVEEFLVTLQEEFPATIPTVFRTGGKLEQPDANQQSQELAEDSICILCSGELKEDMDRSNAVEASDFSQFLSDKGPASIKDEELTSKAILNMKFGKALELEQIVQALEQTTLTSGSCSQPQSSSCSGEGQCGDGGGCSSRKAAPKELTISDMDPFLCYSCRMTARKSNKIPEFLQTKAEVRLRRRAMKDDISDFLL